MFAEEYEDLAQSVGVSFEIGSATLEVAQGPDQAPVEKPRRGRKPKVAVAPQPAEAAPPVIAVQEEETPKMIRVRPKYGNNLYCHTQQKLLYAGFDTPILRDKWIANQIRKGILVVV